MQKVYKGYELMKKIAKEEIKENTKLRIENYDRTINVIFNGCDLITDDNENLTDIWSLYAIMISNFTVIKNEEEIDIQEIEEYNDYFIDNSRSSNDIKDLAKKYNLLVKSVKQLDKKMKGE